MEKSNTKLKDLGVEDLVTLAEDISYKKYKRIREIISIMVFAVLSTTAMVKLVEHTDLPSLTTAPSMIVATFLGILGADFVSGLVHWTLDSWGSINIPIIGKSLMIPFREHHVDPTAFTRRDFIVTWGDACMVSAPVMSAIVYLLFYMEARQIKDMQTIFWMLTILVITAASNNQTHKWAHTRTGNPKWVDLLQKMHIVLPKAHHHLHHTPPHTTNYCIVTGWANYPLEYINFWRRLEWIIEITTGFKPRQDDMKWSKKKQDFMKLSNKLALRLSKEATEIQ